MVSKDAFIAANRFGLGPLPLELSVIDKNPRAWLKRQIVVEQKTPPLLQNLPSVAEIMRIYVRNRQQGNRGQGNRQGNCQGENRQGENRGSGMSFRQQQGRDYRNSIYARTLNVLQSSQPFAERMVSFWSNHFTVSNASRKIIGPIAVAYETDTIRPHIFGNFKDMLRAAIHHPTMLLYLGNHISMGPNSSGVLNPRGGGRGRARVRGLNENLAREIMELHTLGVNGGYTQKDVTEFAKVITGWSFGGRGGGPEGPHGFRFKRWYHEPGPKTVLGHVFDGGGEDEGIDALKMMAHHPATAKFIATKLVRHFVSDKPPASAIAKIERVFNESKGNLAKVSEALIDLEEAWKSPFSKTKQPYELVLSTYRALDIGEPNKNDILKSLGELHQFPFKASSPAGWSDLSEDWLTPESLMRRIEWTRALAAKLPRSVKAEELFADTIGSVASKQTTFWVKAAPSSEEAIALILASPEFQRR
jgi:uncharacterized protein (DUF1800 family)